MAKRTEGHRKGHFEYGRRVRSPGGAVPAKHKRRRWGQTPGAAKREVAQRRFEPLVSGRPTYYVPAPGEGPGRRVS